jgi:hypothetical protein
MTQKSKSSTKQPKNEPKPEKSPVKILVKKDLTDKDVGVLARSNSQRHLRLGELELQLKAATKDYKSKMDTEKTEINRVNNLISAGFEMVEANALVIFFPDERIKKFYYPTAKQGVVGDFIREEPMQESDFHRNLFGEEEHKEAGDDNGAEKAGDGALPNPVIPEG